MKTAYSVGLYGNDPKVLDGSWKKMFDEHDEGPTEGDKGGPGGLDSWAVADGIEDGQLLPLGPNGNRNKASTSMQSEARGHKREHSQGTLDGAFKKAKG